jgi:hypothetical protein
LLRKQSAASQKPAFEPSIQSAASNEFHCGSSVFIIIISRWTSLGVALNLLMISLALSVGLVVFA